MERPAGDKHSSLLRKITKYSCKKFHNILRSMTSTATCTTERKVPQFVGRAREPLLEGKTSTVDFLIKIGCLGKEKNILSGGKAAGLSYIV
jgi:hypothetical protein